MFGYVSANTAELSQPERERYGAVYCGICRQIGRRSSQLARMTLSYDMVFLALLLMSLYEPEEHSAKRACLAHPLRRREFLTNEFIAYAADMNVALAYYKALDDCRDDHSLRGRFAAFALRRSVRRIAKRYPRQCGAIRLCTEQLAALERENCPNPDLCAACFGALMAELFLYREDNWESPLRKMADALGRFVYLADATADYDDDKRRRRFNPFLAMGVEARACEDALVRILGRCTTYYASLPLLQDKALLDNILYSGVWTALRAKQTQEESQ